MALPIVFLMLWGAWYTAARLEQALAACALLMEHGIYRREQIVLRRKKIFAWAVLASSGLLAIAVGVVAPEQRLEFTVMDKVAVLIITTGVTYSQLFAQWALRECRRRIPEDER